MDTSPLDFYKSQKIKYEQLLENVQKELNRYSLLRFSAFALTVFFVYYFFGEENKMIGAFVFGSTGFGFFLKKYWKKKERRQELLALLKINIVEIDAINGYVTSLSSGDEFKDSSHPFSFDIDLFGSGSFFQYLNRTVTKAGKRKLVSLLTENNIYSIQEKQEAIQELCDVPIWRQQFSAKASAVITEIEPVEITKWMQNHIAKIPTYLKIIPLLFSSVSLLLILGILFLNISFSFITIWFFLGLGFSGLYVKKVNSLYTKAGKAKATFLQYHKLLESLEATSFSSQLLKEQHQKIFSEYGKASDKMKEFFGYLNALDQRNNIIFAIFGNGLLLWDVKQAYRVERWMQEHKESVSEWFDVISFFDAQHSMANYAFNHPKFTYANVKSEGDIISAKELGHPLIDENKRITSDCTLGSEMFFVVTGANMAGKSTFLRTVSLSIVMSNMGLPICATIFDYKPIKLITSIRNSDSLTEDTSYFFSELKRLKFIVEALKKEKYFIILDEILKGTNSTDKAEGSQKFVEKLVNSKATGIIATHDLSLCEIEKKYQQIENYYFDAEIKNDELFFDYKLKRGICKNMNASFLLRKMEIV